MMGDCIEPTMEAQSVVGEAQYIFIYFETNSLEILYTKFYLELLPLNWCI
jgi:hypothetical protein